MTGNILGEPFDIYVRNQIEARQKIYGGGYDPLNPRTPETLNYLNNRNAWVKLASSVYIQTGPNTGSIDSPGEQKLRDIGFSMSEINLYGGTNLAKSAVLFNGLSQFNEFSESDKTKYTFRQGVSRDTSLWNNTSAYGLGGSNFGIQPMPGISDVSVECVNRGSIRKAVVNIIAHNKFQFELIELLYIRLGFTMMLEWGWDKYIDSNTGTIEDVGNTIIEDTTSTGWFTSKGISQLEMLRKIESYRARYQGNYDGFFGKVSNFNWKFNPDGTYSITLDLITVGDVIESIKIRNRVNPLDINEIKSFSIQENDDPERYIDKLSEDSPIIGNANNDILSQYLFLTIKENKKFNSKDSNYNYIKITAGKDKDNPNNNYRYYMTLGELLKKIQYDIIPKIQNGSTEEDQLQIEYSEGAKSVNVCTSYFNLISIDPRICLIRPEISDSLPKIGSKIDENKIFKIFKPFTEQVTIGEEGSDGTILFPYGKLLNIYLNYDFIAKALNSNATAEDINIYEFLREICNGINKALGNITNLEPIVKDDSVITIIDQNALPEALYKVIAVDRFTDTTPVDLEVYGYNPTATSGSSTFVKDVSFNTKITPKLAAQISIAATADGVGTQNIESNPFSKWSTGLTDRFAEKIIQPTKPSNPQPPSPERPTDEELEALYNNRDTKENIFGVEYQVYQIEYTLPDGKVIEVITDDDYGVDYFKRKIYEAWDEYETRRLEEIKSGETPWERYLSKAFLKNQYWDYNNDFINEGKDVLIKTLNEDRNISIKLNSNNTPNTLGFIPIDFGLTMDGLSGIKIYQQLKIRQEFLPRQYPRAFKFLITRVNHKISDNNWDTQLQTISTSNIDKIDKDYIIAIGQTAPNPNIEPKPQPVEEAPISFTGTPPLYKDNRSGESPYANRIIDIDAFIRNEINEDAQAAFTAFFNILNTEYLGPEGSNARYTIQLNALERSFQKSVQLKRENPRNAEPGRSTHNYNAAIDINVTTPDGTFLKKKGNRDQWIKHRFDVTAERAGLKWGGNFSNYEDNIHFYYDFNRNTALQNIKTQFGVTDIYDENQIANIEPTKVKLDRLA